MKSWVSSPRRQIERAPAMLGKSTSSCGWLWLWNRSPPNPLGESLPTFASHKMTSTWAHVALVRLMKITRAPVVVNKSSRWMGYQLIAAWYLVISELSVSYKPTNLAGKVPRVVQSWIRHWVGKGWYKWSYVVRRPMWWWILLSSGCLSEKNGNDNWPHHNNIICTHDESAIHHQSLFIHHLTIHLSWIFWIIDHELAG